MNTYTYIISTSLISYIYDNIYSVVNKCLFTRIIKALLLEHDFESFIYSFIYLFVKLSFYLFIYHPRCSSRVFSHQSIDPYKSSQNPHTH